MSEEYRSHEEIVQEVLGRYSVQDLIEQTHDDLAIGDERFYKAGGALQIVEQGTTNHIRWWKIASGDKTYECRRFKNFVFCSCKSFFFSKKNCKHLALTTNVPCANCHLLSAKVGKLCYDCDMKINHFLKQPRPAAQASSISI